MNDINDEIKYKKLRKKIFAERDAWRDRIVRDAIRIAFNQAIEAGDIDENTPREEALKIQANYIRRNLEASKKARQEREEAEAARQAELLQQRKVTIAAINGRRADLQARKARKDPFAGLEGQALYEAEWAESSELAAKFGKKEYYFAFRSAEDGGLVKILKKKSTSDLGKPPAEGINPETLAAEYESSEALKGQFGSFDVYKVFKRAEAGGQVKISRKKTKKYVMGKTAR
jgi:hypothetical protein